MGSLLQLRGHAPSTTPLRDEQGSLLVFNGAFLSSSSGGSTRLNDGKNPSLANNTGFTRAPWRGVASAVCTSARLIRCIPATIGHTPEAPHEPAELRRWFDRRPTPGRVRVMGNGREGFTSQGRSSAGWTWQWTATTLRRC